MQDENVVLTGFMGTGKTTVGKLLALALGYGFVDTDLLIEGRFGSIADIFATQGEAAFRQMEREVARELAGRTGLVVATGGRMLLDPVNAAALGENGRIFCLTATPEEILARVLGDAAGMERPLLQVANPAQRILELLQARQAQYQQFSQVVTSGKQPDEVTREIVERLGRG